MLLIHAYLESLAVKWLSTHSQKTSVVTKKCCFSLTGFNGFPDSIMILGSLNFLVREEPLERVPDKNLAKYLWWKNLFFSKVSRWMSAALLKFNFSTGVYFAITACYLLFSFQNLRAFFSGDFSQLLLPRVCSYFTKLNWTCIRMLLFPLYMYISKNYFFLTSMETRHRMKAEKMRNPRVQDT